MMTTMIARLRALRWPLLRTVDWTTICAFVSVAQLLSAAAYCLLHYFRPNPWAYYPKPLRCHRLYLVLVICACLLIFHSDKRFTITWRDFCFGYKWFSILRRISRFCVTQLTTTKWQSSFCFPRVWCWSAADYCGYFFCLRLCYQSICCGIEKSSICSICWDPSSRERLRLNLLTQLFRRLRWRLL